MSKYILNDSVWEEGQEVEFLLVKNLLSLQINIPVLDQMHLFPL